MKRIFLLLPLFIFFNCSQIDNPTQENAVVDRPGIPLNKLDVFNLNEVPTINLEFSLSDWNTILQNFDLNPANDEKVVSKFSYLNRSGSVTLDSIGVRLRGNTSRRRPEGSFGELHSVTNPDWHHSHLH
ncbi:MAG: hypothetical protein IPN80_05675 [Flavobacterium sp.]|nr:hypothetical protein [Flavobacterium sp.]